ncbi:MAG: DUF134 domain-containing protein [Candidatus Bathyarchaeia archaeon]
MSGCCWRRRRKRGRIGRPPKPIAITSVPITEKLEPTPRRSEEAVYLDPCEVEALRLIDLEKLSFEEAGIRMKVSRNTVWRLVETAREKLIKAIVEGKEVIIQKED